MSITRQHLGVGFPLVRKVPAALAVTPGQRLPEPTSGSCPSATQRPGHEASARPFDGQPQPDFALLAAHKRPPLLQLEHFPALFLGFFRPQPWQQRAAGLRFFLVVWPPSCVPRPSRARCCVANCVRPTACLPARTAWPWPRPLAQSAPGNDRLYIGSGHGPDYDRCAEVGRCRI